MKKYKAILFDWDGTAVISRTAPAKEAVAAMKPLLREGIILGIISGTTYENIAGGKLESFFTPEELSNLYLGLGRGAYQYAFDQDGKPYVFKSLVPSKKNLLKIHEVSFELHRHLLETYDFATDIVFTRPNYCKIDLMPEIDRKDQLFMQENELEALKKKMEDHGIDGGLQRLLTMAESIGKRKNIKILSTCDAKYLEVGVTSKSENADSIIEKIAEQGISPEECVFWGDEYVGVEKGIYGSDSFMRTEKTKTADFFDVSNVEGERPEGVTVLGGGVNTFLKFLNKQSE